MKNIHRFIPGIETVSRAPKELAVSASVFHVSRCRMSGSLLAVLSAFILYACAAALSPATARAADLLLTGERELYLAVDKLNAMGELPGFLANTRPYSVAAVRVAL